LKFLEEKLNFPKIKNFNRSRSLRKGYVLSEVIFWKQVRNKEFHQIDFDRQKIIGNYIVDFYIKSLGVVRNRWF
jgi:very-short-patch-repair endonuclease